MKPSICGGVINLYVGYITFSWSLLHLIGIPPLDGGASSRVATHTPKAVSDKRNVHTGRPVTNPGGIAGTKPISILG